MVAKAEVVAELVQSHFDHSLDGDPTRSAAQAPGRDHGHFVAIVLAAKHELVKAVGVGVDEVGIGHAENVAANFLVVVVPPSVTEGGMPIELEAKVSEYLSLMMKLIFAFGLCFQLPVIMTLLARVGLATSKGMAAKRKYAIVGVFVVAAIFTPPDPLSQLMLAIPIVLLYEISIYMARMVEKKRPKDEYDDDDDDDLEDETAPA